MPSPRRVVNNCEPRGSWNLPPGSDHEPSISRPRILGAAAALPLAALPGDPPGPAPAPGPAAALWSARLNAYQRLAVRARAAAETGWFRAANDLYYRQCAEIADRFGGQEAAARSEEACRLYDHAFERLDRAEQLYWRRCTAPAEKAAIALALTPAPDIAALRAKLTVLRAHALDEDGALPRPALKLVDEDLRRMTG